MSYSSKTLPAPSLLIGRGDRYADQGNREKALECYQEAARICYQTPSRPYVRETIRDLRERILGVQSRELVIV